MNRDCDYDALLDGYFALLFGKDPLYNPARAEKLEQVFELAAVARTLVKKNRKAPVRTQALAWRLLERHAEFSAGMADVFIAKARGFNKLALEKLEAFTSDFDRYHYELERSMDFGHWVRLTRSIVIKMPFVEY